MAEKIIVPAFATEAEEAQWWFDHREETGRALVEASQQVRNGEGSLGRHARKLRELTNAESSHPEAMANSK
jgi:hypothetical protein